MRIVRRFWLVVACLLAPLAAARGGEPRALWTISGPPYQAELLGVDDNWQLLLKRTGDPPANAPQRLAAAEVVSWGVPAETPARSLVFFADGSQLVGSLLKLDKDELQVYSSLFGKLSLPLELVQGLMLRPPPDALRRDLLVHRLFAASDAQGKPRDADLLILENGDELSGNITSLDDKRGEFETSGTIAKLETAKIAVLAFNPSLLARLPKRGLRSIVGFSDGSRLTATKLIVDDKQALVTPLDSSAVAGRTWSTSADRVVFLQPLGGKVAYLSDLPVASYRHIPYLTLGWPYRFDRSVTGGQLRAGGQLYAKGIGMHSAARLTFDLDKSYRRFEAQLAIDDETLGRGSVTFRVFVDRQQKFASEIIRGGQATTPISVDVSGARQISLVVDFAERGDELDDADWLNARLVE